jgi:hypothetical protein
MNPDPQLARVEIILSAPRPQPEPAEGELRAVLEHLGASPEATTKATSTAKAGR